MDNLSGEIDGILNGNTPQGQTGPSSNEPASSSKTGAGARTESGTGQRQSQSSNDSIPEELRGKSPEQIAAIYGMLKDQNSRMVGALNTFNFLVKEDDKGDIVLNDDVLYAYLQKKGRIASSSNGQDAQRKREPEPDPLEAFDEEQKKAMQTEIDRRLQAMGVEQRVQAVEQTAQQSRLELLAKAMEQKYSDFHEVVPLIAKHQKTYGWQFGSLKDLENAYLMTKALEGKMTDSKISEQQLENLRKSYTVLQGGSRMPSPEQLQALNDPMNAPIEHLIGYNLLEKDPQMQEMAKVWCGKSSLKPPTD